MILNECDLIVSVGARLGIRQVGQFTEKFAPHADLVRCDIDEYELSRNIKEGEKKYHTDARDFMRMIMETQHFNHQDRFAATAVSGGYTVPKFEKIAEAYGIRAVALNSYDELDKYAEWIVDCKPCVFVIPLPEMSFLTPKIKFETGVINPKIDEITEKNVKALLK